MPAFPPRTPAAVPLVTSFHADTCGTCKYGSLVTADINMVECRGAPPTPVFAPTPQGYQLVLMRPTMPRSEGACGVHKAKPPVLQS